MGNVGTNRVHLEVKFSMQKTIQFFFGKGQSKLAYEEKKNK